MDLIYGRQSVLEALRAGLAIQRLRLAAGVRPRGPIAAIVQLAQERGLPIEYVDRRLLDRLTGGANHQGVVAEVPPFAYAPLEAIFRRLQASPEPGLVLVLDHLQDPQNFGTLLRTAEASGLVGGVFLVDCVDAYNPKVVRAAMGAHFYLPLWPDASWAEVRQHLAGRPVWLAAVREGLPYDQVDWTRPAALIVGSEAHGPGPEARAIATGQVHIPMGGRAESLNAAIAAAIIIFEAARQRRQRQTIQTAPATTERGRSGTAQGEGVAD